MKASLLTYLTLGCVCAAQPALAGGQAEAGRTWTDVTGNHRVEGTFVSLAEGKVSLKKNTGELVTLPLTKLSPPDQEFVRLQSEGGTPADGSKPAPVTGEVKSSAKATFGMQFSIVDGKAIKSKTLKIDLTLTGGAADEAYAIGKVTTEPLEAGGKRLKLQDRVAEFTKIERDSKNSASQHPKDGVKLSLDFGMVEEIAQSLGPIKGTVMMAVGGKEQTLEIGDVHLIKDRPLKDPSLEKAGIRASLFRTEDEGDISIGVTFHNAFHGASLEVSMIGADGKEITGTKGHLRIFNDVSQYIGGLKPSQLKDAKLVIRFREGAKMVPIPFHVAEIPAPQ